MCVGLGYEISGKTLCIFQAEADERESRAEVAKLFFSNSATA